MSKFYILDNRKAVPCDSRAWARAMERKDEWRVGNDTIGDARVSTVFLGLDHAMPGEPPAIFETMVFGGPLHEEMVRYATWEEAEAGHQAMVERVSHCA